MRDNGVLDGGDLPSLSRFRQDVGQRPIFTATRAGRSRLGVGRSWALYAAWDDVESNANAGVAGAQVRPLVVSI